MDCYIYRKSIDYKEKEESKEQEEFKQEETTQIKSPHSISLLTEETDLLRSSPYCNMNIEGNVSDRHFGIWAGKLLFLSVYSNQPSASLVVRRVIRGRMGRRQEDVVSYYDEDHMKTVNLQKFDLFLEEYVRTEAIQGTYLLLK